MKSQCGFTLMEVLVALVVLGVMLAGFMTLSASQAQRAAYLADKTVASVVAGNVITEMQLARTWPAEEKFSQTITMANKEWKVTGTVQETASADMKRVEIDVALVGAAPVATLVGFVGKY